MKQKEKEEYEDHRRTEDRALQGISFSLRSDWSILWPWIDIRDTMCRFVYHVRTKNEDGTSGRNLSRLGYNRDLQHGVTDKMFA